MMYRVRLASGAVVSANKSHLRLTVVESSCFPLGSLPAPCLALVLSFLPVSEAAQLARVSKRFAASFCDAVSWEKRCERDLTHIDVAAVFASEKEQSWMKFYARHADMTVFILFGSIRRLIPVNFSDPPTLGAFKVTVSPRMTVGELIAMLEVHPMNPDKKRIRFAAPKGLHKPGDRSVAKPNCVFSAVDYSATVEHAGLFHCAVLEVAKAQEFRFD